MDKNISLAIACVFFWLCGFMVGLWATPMPLLEGIGCEGVNSGAYDGTQKLFAFEEDHFPKCAVIQENAWYR